MAPAGDLGCMNLFVGDCGEKEYFFYHPKFVRFDMTLRKKFPIGGRRVFSLQIDVLNVFDNINFSHNFNPGGSWRVTSAYSDTNGTFDPGGRLGQFVWRIDW